MQHGYIGGADRPALVEIELHHDSLIGLCRPESAGIGRGESGLHGSSGHILRTAVSDGVRSL